MKNLSLLAGTEFWPIIKTFLPSPQPNSSAPLCLPYEIISAGSFKVRLCYAAFPLLIDFISSNSHYGGDYNDSQSYLYLNIVQLLNNSLLKKTFRSGHGRRDCIWVRLDSPDSVTSENYSAELWKLQAIPLLHGSERSSIDHYSARPSSLFSGTRQSAGYARTAQGSEERFFIYRPSSAYHRLLFAGEVIRTGFYVICWFILFWTHFDFVELPFFLQQVEVDGSLTF